MTHRRFERRAQSVGRGITIILSVLMLCLVPVFHQALAQAPSSKKSTNTVWVPTGTTPKFGQWINGQTASVFDPIGAQSQGWEELVTGTAPATVSVSISGCGAGGTCSASPLVTSTSVTSTLLTSTGAFDHFNVTVSWTGGDTTTNIAINGVLTTSRTGGSGATAGNGIQVSGNTISSAVVISNTAAGADLCQRIINQQIATPGRTVSAQNDGANTLQDCGTDDLQSPSTVGTIQMPAGGIRTSVGFHVGDRDNIFGEGTGNGGNTGTGPRVGTNYLVTSTFPTNQAGGGGITTSGTNTAGATSLTIVLATGTGNVPLQIQPGSTFVLPGDPGQYIVKNCAAAGSLPCSPTIANGTGTSFYYTLTPGTPITINITTETGGTLGTSPVNGTAVLLVPPVVAIGEQNTTCNGCSAQDSIIKFGFVNGDSANGSTGNCIGYYAGQAAQENSRYEDMLVRNCAIGFRIFGAPDSGVYKQLNVSYNISVNTCNTPGNGQVTYIPYEFGLGQYAVQRTTAFVDSCSAAEVPFGLYHITDNKVNAVGGATFELSDSHGEMCGAWNGSNSCTSGALAGDNILVDSTSGSVKLDKIAGCPSSFPCLNLVHVASTFVGTLDVEQINCNTGTQNIIKDDVNGNTLLCSAAITGGFYHISLDGTPMTNIDCAHMTKGFCYNSTGWGIFAGGVLQYKISNSGILANYDAVATTGLGTPFQVSNDGATGVTIGTGTSIAVTSLCSTAQCPSGLYEVDAYVLITTPCTTGGSYSVWINYTDSGGAKSAATQLIPFNGVSGPLASSAIVPIAGTYAFGNFILQTTGAANQALGSINYGTTAVACGTGGPMVGKLFLITYRLA